MTDAASPDTKRQRIDEARGILSALGLPSGVCNERTALVLLAFLDLTPDRPWSAAAARLLSTTKAMDFVAEHYNVPWKENTRETVRDHSIRPLADEGILLVNPDNPDLPKNSPLYAYRIEPSFLELIRSFGTSSWPVQLQRFLAGRELIRTTLAADYAARRIPVHLPQGGEVTLSPGGQNVLIQSIVHQFCTRFTPGGTVIYLGDAETKWPAGSLKLLDGLGIKIDPHGPMPDVVVLVEEKNWLVLIEAALTDNPFDESRHQLFKRIFEAGTAGVVYVTALPNRQALVQVLRRISWRTEVWLAEEPDHLIHFDGERFLGPYNQ